MSSTHLFLREFLHLHKLIDKETKMNNLLTVLSQCLTSAHHSLSWKSHGVNLSAKQGVSHYHQERIAKEGSLRFCFRGTVSLLAHLPFAILRECIQGILLFALDILGRRSSFQIWPGHPFCGPRGNRRIGRPWFWRRRATAQLFGSGYGLAFLLDFGHQIAETLRSFKRSRILVNGG